MALKLKRNPVAFAASGGSAEEWMTADGRFYIQRYGKKGWTVYAESVADFHLLQRSELEDRYFPTRKDAVAALEAALQS